MAAFTLPDLRIPALTGSFISITLPGLHIAPLSSDVVKVTTSDSLFSANNIFFARRFACPLEVQANAFTCFTTVPIFAINALSSTTSKSTSCESML